MGNHRGYVNQSDTHVQYLPSGESCSELTLQVASLSPHSASSATLLGTEEGSINTIRSCKGTATTRVRVWQASSRRSLWMQELWIGWIELSVVPKTRWMGKQARTTSFSHLSSRRQPRMRKGSSPAGHPYTQRPEWGVVLRICTSLVPPYVSRLHSVWCLVPSVVIIHFASKRLQLISTPPPLNTHQLRPT